MDQKVLVAVKSTLVVIEKSLREILREAGSEEGPKDWVLKVRHSDLPDEIRSDLVIKAKEMLNEIRELQSVFEIEKEGESVRAHLIGNLTQVWVMLSELSREKLQAYGQLTPRESGLLASHVDRMSEIREEMEKLVST